MGTAALGCPARHARLRPLIDVILKLGKAELKDRTTPSVVNAVEGFARAADKAEDPDHRKDPDMRG